MAEFFDPDDWQPKPSPITPSVSVAPSVESNEIVTTAAASMQTFFELKPVSPSNPTASAALNSEILTEEPKFDFEIQPVRLPQPVRIPAPLEIPLDFPEFEAPVGYEVDLSDLPIGSEEPLTRRQIREFERLTGSDMTAEISDSAGSIEVRLPYDDDLIEQLPDLANTGAISLDESIPVPDFAPSPGLVLEPTTNSIVIDQVQDLENYTATVSETGEILTTGTIQLPIVVTDSPTGEIDVIAQADALDTAIQAESGAGYINSVAPMRVTGVVNAMAKSKVIAANLRRGVSHPFQVLIASVIIFGFGALVVTALMLNII